MLGRCNGVQRQVAVGEFSRTATSTEQHITDMDIWIWASGQWDLTSRFTYMRAISALLLNTTLINATFTGHLVNFLLDLGGDSFDPPSYFQTT